MYIYINKKRTIKQVPCFIVHFNVTYKIKSEMYSWVYW